MIKKITRQEVLAGCREVLGLNDTNDAIVEDKLLTALIRRSAGIQCPCSRATLVSSLTDALQFLYESDTSLTERIETTIEGLVVAGDLLELHDVGVFDHSVKSTWVFAAPPSYIVSRSGEIFIVGIVADQDTFLPNSLASRICMRGFTRLIVPEDNEDCLSTELDDEGLQRLSEDSWLKSPNAESFGQMLIRFERKLADTPPAGTVNELEILDGDQPVTYYSRRWSTCTGKTGVFVGRRPQEFGVPIWCIADVEAGRVTRFLDLPASNSRWRGCDEAWHLQMAIDAKRGSPQQYRVQFYDNECRFDFFSPLPAWSERRLMVFGRPVPREKCLMSYILPLGVAGFEEKFLQKRLWLSRREDSE